jgi:hypothetical protein
MHPSRKNLVLVGAAGTAILLGVGAALADGWSGPGPHFGARGPGGMRLMDQFDTDKDGRLTQAEIDAARKAQVSKYDANGDGVLSLEEYQVLWLDAMRPLMVRQFQANDSDGNAAITVDEFTARFAHMVRDLDRNGDGVLTVDELRGPRHGPGPRPAHDDDN